MTAQPRLLDAPTTADIREARVLWHGLGYPVATLTVRIVGVDGTHVILAPPKDPPRLGARIMVRETAAGWTYAGRADA